MDGRRPPTFRGRGQEVALCLSLLDADRDDPVGIVLEAEPGAGRRRLAAEVAARARGGGVRVLAGRCPGPAARSWPLQPFLDALGAKDDPLDGVPPRRVLAVLERRLTDAAGAGPALVVLDDLPRRSPRRRSRGCRARGRTRCCRSGPGRA